MCDIRVGRDLGFGIELHFQFMEYATTGPSQKNGRKIVVDLISNTKCSVRNRTVKVIISLLGYG
jgi:hypothetical protein